MWKSCLVSLVLLASCQTEEKEVIWEPDFYGVNEKGFVVGLPPKGKLEYMCLHKNDIKVMYQKCLDKKESK